MNVQAFSCYRASASVFVAAVAPLWPTLREAFCCRDLFLDVKRKTGIYSANNVAANPGCHLTAGSQPPFVRRGVSSRAGLSGHKLIGQACEHMESFQWGSSLKRYHPAFLRLET